MLKDLLLFALLPACCGALAVGATLVLPGGGDAAAPRDLFSACLINGIAAFTLPGVIQVWFTMGETRRANQERERARQAEERADRERAGRERELLALAQERADRERELLALAQERADREREFLALAQENTDRERERARQAESELADTRVQMAELVAVVTDLRRRLDERDNGSGAH